MQLVCCNLFFNSRFAISRVESKSMHVLDLKSQLNLSFVWRPRPDSRERWTRIFKRFFFIYVFLALAKNTKKVSKKKNHQLAIVNKDFCLHEKSFARRSKYVSRSLNNADYQSKHFEGIFSITRQWRRKKNPPIASQLRNIFTRKTTTKIKERSGFDIYQFQLVVKRREEERKGAT